MISDEHGVRRIEPQYDAGNGTTGPRIDTLAGAGRLVCARFDTAIKQALAQVPPTIEPRVFTMVMPNFPIVNALVTRCDEQGWNPKGSKPADRHNDLGYWKIKERKCKHKI